MKEMTFNFTVFVEETEGSRVAHCLEMGLVAVHQDEDELISVMSKLIVRQLQFALENDNPGDIYHSAPPDVWTRFRFRVSKQEIRPERSQKPLQVNGWPTVLCNQDSYALSYAHA
jgi:hypothetical protein